MLKPGGQNVPKLAHGDKHRQGGSRPGDNEEPSSCLAMQPAP